MGTNNQPPVEAIQGEARAREVLAEAWGDHPQWEKLRQDIRSGSTSIHSDTTSLACTIAIRAMLAFQSEARAVPSGGELRDMPADDEIRLLREALTIYGDRVRMARSARPNLQQVIDYAFEHTPNRPAFGGDSETRHLPHQADREAIARVREALRVEMLDQTTTGKRKTYSDGYAQGICHAIEQIDAILALSPTPSAGRDGGGDDISAMAQFLCDRLDNLDWQDFEDTTRDFMGHVDPALSRLKKALATLPPATEKAEK